MKNHLIRSHFPVTILLFMVVTCALSSCRKNSYCFLIPPDFKEWTFADQNSYWIYKNDSTGREDSISVSNDPGIITGSCPEYSSQYHDESYFETYYFYTGSPFGSTYKIMASNCFTKFSIDYDNTFIPAYLVNGEDQCEAVGYTFIEKIPMMSLNGHEFNDVIHTKYSHYQGLFEYEFYIARHIGIIKVKQQTMESDSTWSLLRWNVIQ